MIKVTRRDGESLDQMLRRFKNAYLSEGILDDIRRKEYYKSKGQLAREAKQKSERKFYIEKLKEENKQNRRKHK